MNVQQFSVNLLGVTLSEEKYLKPTFVNHIIYPLFKVKYLKLLKTPILKQDIWFLFDHADNLFMNKSYLDTKIYWVSRKSAEWIRRKTLDS